MYLWDTPILYAFIRGHPQLQIYLEHVPWSDILLPSIVVAELMRSRCYATLNALPASANSAHQRLIDTQVFLTQFQLARFDQQCEEIFARLAQQHHASKAYNDLMISSIAYAKNYIVVTSNIEDFMPILPHSQLNNWLIEPTQ